MIEEKEIDTEMIKKLPVSVANPNSNVEKYYCNQCGHVDKYKFFYNPRKFVCEKCGNDNFLEKNVKKSTTIIKNQYSVDNDEFDEETKVLKIKYKVGALVSFNPFNVKEKYDEIYFNFETGETNFNESEYTHFLFSYRDDHLKVIFTEYYNKIFKYPLEYRKYTIENLSLYSKYPNLIVLDKYFEPGYPISSIVKNYNETALYKILGISKAMFKLINEYSMQSHSLGYDNTGIVLDFSTTRYRLNYHVIRDIQNEIYLGTDQNKILDILNLHLNKKMKKTITEESFDYNMSALIVKEKYNLEKLNKYKNEQLEYQSMHAYQFDNYLIDYIKMNRDMNISNYEKYPRNIKVAHDSMVKIYDVVKDEIKNKQLKKIYSSLNHLAFEDKRYKIVLPGDIDDIINEGKKLRHCVGSYIDSIINGSSIILLIRENENIDKPFYTLELNSDLFPIQCLGFANKSTTASVKSFMKKYKEYLSSYKKAI